MAGAPGSVALRGNERRRLIAQARRTRDQYSEDSALLKANHEEWRKRYVDQWIAIYRGDVYGPTKTQDELIRRLRARGVPVLRAVFHYFSPVRRLRIV